MNGAFSLRVRVLKTWKIVRMYTSYVTEVNQASEMTDAAASGTGMDGDAGVAMVTAASEDTVKLSQDYKSAVVIMPPESVWKQIQDIRRIHDSRFERWMPHINLLFPFLKDRDKVFAEEGDRLQHALQHIQPVSVRFTKDSFNYFVHKKNCTLWLRPLVMERDKLLLDRDESACADQTRENNSINANLLENQTTEGATAKLDIDESSLSKKDIKRQKKIEKKIMSKRRRDEGSLLSEAAVNNPPHPSVINIQSCLQDLYPELAKLQKSSDVGFQPHLSLGQFSLHEVEEYKTRFQENWEDIEFEVCDLCLISRKDFYDPFHVRVKVLLGAKS